jgi:hypothetical protein
VLEQFWGRAVRASHDSQEFMGRFLFWEASFARDLTSAADYQPRRNTPPRMYNHFEKYMRAFRELRV